MKFIPIYLICFGVSIFVSSEQAADERNEISELRQYMMDLARQLQGVVSATEELRKDVNVLSKAKSDQLNTILPEQGLLNNNTVEERVAVLEFQVTEISEDVTDLQGDVLLLEGDQNILDDKILQLEIDSNGFESSIESLVATDVQILVELSDLGDTTNQIDGRVSSIEVNGTVAFHASLPTETIPDNTVIIFQDVNLNIGNGYDSSTGKFTVPPGGSGLYYIYVHGIVSSGKSAGFRIRHNEAVLCRSYGEVEYVVATCGAAVVLQEGDVVDVFMDYQSDDTPLYIDSDKHNTFTAMRIAPQ